MDTWGTDLPIGTVMKDPNTLKLYCWNGSIWLDTFESTKKNNDIQFEIQMFNYNQWNVHELEEKQVKRGRGRPKTKKNTQNKRQPSEYNLYVKKQILDGAYSHLVGKERLALIAKDWMNCAGYQ